MAFLNGDNHRGENVALAGLAVVVALIVAYAILMRPDADLSGESDLARTMPDNYKAVLAAMVRASGQECDRVCKASVAGPLLGSPRVLVSCSVAAENIACETARQFEISVKPAAEPSR